MPQSTIHTLMIRAARRGQRVVRLKGGDPFVFGRGGEEALALRAAHVPFEIIPGVTSAVAAPALAGIPVTHRGVSSAFMVVAGHAPESYLRVLERVSAGAMTLVFLMAVAEQCGIAAALLARGWTPSTPAALLFAASWDNAETWTGTLAELASGGGVFDSERAGIIVVGDVVSVRDQLGIGVADARPAIGGAIVNAEVAL
jgi:uroporphyrin-III C-methyltransferase/precorrin-2 dehydrogenase/sirohydrochlorin ferrochelatase